MKRISEVELKLQGSKTWRKGLLSEKEYRSKLEDL